MILEKELFNQTYDLIPSGKIVINALNAHCYNIAKKDQVYREALLNCDILIPDGISVVWATKWLTGKKLKKIAGIDFLNYEIERIQKGGKCFFLGSTETTLEKIKDRLKKDYPEITVQSYSPPFMEEFDFEENRRILEKINSFQPDVLFIGMTAPKQEKWAYLHLDQLKTGHICCVGAVFDFFAGTINRAPVWMITIGLEWFYRLIREPLRLWKRYLFGNPKFIWYILKERSLKFRSIT